MNWTGQKFHHSKLNWLSICSLTFSFLSSASLLTIWSALTNSALAQCVQADVSVQYNISGSKEPTERNNQIEMQGSDSCRGNASVTTGVQGNEGGTGKVVQNRTVRHRFEENPNSNSQWGGATVQIRSNPEIDVYNAADQLKY
ncbi:hypothetical protein STA3757_10470 [Stanieria sp. NIES-3757]|nr:hypothetical protein STA3757_10470 [Stanieria sp. NIES-3757]